MIRSERRRRSRDLPPPPAAKPEARQGEGAAARAEELRQSLQQHPALSNARLLGLGRDLRKGGRVGAYLAALRPLWHLEPAPSTPAHRGEELPVTLRPSLEQVPASRLDDQWCALIGGDVDGDAAPPPCPSLEIVRRVRGELGECGNPWVAAGAVGLGQPLAWVILSRSLLHALEEAGEEVPAELCQLLRDEDAREREVLNQNLARLAPYLHDPEVEGSVRCGAERLLDGWQVMLNGLDHRVFGGVQAL